MIDKIIELENIYSKNNYYGEKINDKSYKIKKGNIPILLSVPHSVRQLRNGNIKSQDIMTGGIVDYIQEKTNCFSITNVCFSDNDPNYDDIKSCLYKQELIKIIKENNIKLLIDFHGLDLKKESLIDVCTNNNRNLLNRLDILDEIFEKFEIYGEYITLNKYYNADKEFCVCNCIRNICNIPCVELEINKSIRNPYENKEEIELFIKKIIELIFFLDNII